MQEISIYLRDPNPPEPFSLLGYRSEVFVVENRSDRPLLRGARRLTPVPDGAAVTFYDGTTRIIRGKFKKTKVRVGGIKQSRIGADLGALPDLTTTAGFVISVFEMPSYQETGPLFPGRTPWRTLFLTDRELAAIWILIDPGSLTVSQQSLEQGKTPGKLLDDQRRRIASVRKRFGYLQTARPHLTKQERTDWIASEMKRPVGARPAVPWPRPLPTK